MNATKSDYLVAALADLRSALAYTTEDVQQWAERVHDALGHVADAVHDDVDDAGQSLADVGEINPDFQDAPVAERHVEANRVQMTQLVEHLHELRAEMRQAHDLRPLDMIQLRLRAEDIINAIAEVRSADDRFLVDTFNSNLGAGE